MLDPSMIISLVVTLIIVVFSLGITLVSLAVPGFIFYTMWKSSQKTQALLANGTPAVGRVLQLAQTGTFINNNPQVLLTLEVQPIDGDAYQANLTTVVPLVSLPRVQPGQVLDVRVDPQDRTQVAVAGL